MKGIRNFNGIKFIRAWEKAGLPRSTALGVLKFLRVLVNIHELKHRKKLAKELLEQYSEEFRVPYEKGYLLLNNNNIPGLDNIIAFGQNIFASMKAAGTLPVPDKNRDADYQLDLLNSRNPAEIEKFIEFSVQPAIIAIAASYLNEIPVLQSVKLMWSPVNTNMGSSQLFHIDRRYREQIKFSFNVWDTNEGSGPFSFLPADVSTSVSKKLRYNGGRLDDEDVYAHCDRIALVQSIGNAGTGAAVDTSRCLHFGGRTQQSERLILRLNFASLISPLMRRSDIMLKKWNIDGNISNLVLLN